MSEHIVIGAGLAGAATALALARRGERVTILEQHVPANDRGSSHGSARIFRYAYPNRLYTDLVVRSKALWDDIAGFSGTQLIAETGAIDHGDTRDAPNLAKIFEAVGIDHELLSADDARSRWPQFEFNSDVLWHPGAGVLDSQTAVDTMLDLAQNERQVRVFDDWTVASVSKRSTVGFRVTASSGEVVEGDSIIVAAGGWLPSLLSELPLPPAFVTGLPRFEVRQEMAFHMPYRNLAESGRSAEVWPTFIHKSQAINTYGLPGGRDAGFAGQKLAQFNGGRVIESALEQDGQINPDMRTRMIEYAKRYLPGLVPEPYAETTCLFTNTPNEDFIIDRADGVVVLSACSGHGAKFAPLLGELAADLATGGNAVPDDFRVAPAQL